MNCVIPGVNIKTISKALQALSKIGDELKLVANHDHLLLRSVNMTATAFCTYKFSSSFFSCYEVQAPTGDNDDSEGALGCLIPMKAVLGIFKQHGHKDNRPETCKIQLDYNATNIVFKLKYKHDVLVKRSLYLSDGEIITVSYSTDTALSHISANAQLFSQVLANFQTADDDMSIEVTRNKAIMRNYIAGDTNKTKGIRSQLSLTVGEFNGFRIGQETVITYSLKPFRAVVQFAETFNLPIALYFESAGRPMLLVVKNPTFEANLIIATLHTDQSSQSTLASTKKTHQTPNKHNMTVQDQHVLESVNWDNDMDLRPLPTKNGINTGDKSNVITAENVIKGVQPTLNNENNNKDNDDGIVGSPNSPRNKRIKSIFDRCYEATFHATMMDLGQVLVADSDPESE